MTLNENKTVRGVERINIFGYEIEKVSIAPAKKRLQPLLDMVAPKTLKELKQVRGLFAYYAKGIADFSSKIKPLTETEVFPLSTKAKVAFELLKKDLGKVTLMSINENEDFTVETDASNVAISATLNQNNKPLGFFSNTLNASQKLYPSVEKEAMSTVEANKHWAHFLGRKKFKLSTDQRPVAYMFDNLRKSKIKNMKIQNWRLELSSYRFDVKYRPGPLNFAADAITRNFKTKVKSAQVSSISVKENLSRKLHTDLG